MEVEYLENQGGPAKKGAAKQRAGPLAGMDANAQKKGGKGKSIEEVYQKKTQLEHILLRPDTYVGSTEHQTQSMWVHDGERMVCRTISYVPGLYKIFDEILVNAADNKVRDPSMDCVRVDIDPASNTIRVFNNGDGIPVEIHKDEKVYVPELIFGHLLTSSNYNDSDKKVTGGRNGYGAKLANIFSTEFVVETCDGKRQKRYKQVFRNNMSEKGDPEIRTCSSSDNWTCITFRPDLAKFGMEKLEDDTVELMRKRVYDLAGILGRTTKVYLDGKRLPINKFEDYVDLYLGKKSDGVARVYERVNERWEVCVSISEGQFNQVSFANSICTSKGGTHVNHVADAVVKDLVAFIQKKHKVKTLKPFQVKNHLFVFVNAMIENPAFDSQTKENLTLRPDKFGSKCELSDKFLKKVADCGVVDNILSWHQFKQQKELKKQDGTKTQRITGIPKLDDANDAGGRNSADCTLILTEGDSAKALAISGLSVVGRDKYGVFPLRGKLLNVRDATHTQIMNNTEISSINKILGLQHGKVYDTVKSLRYGHLMIMTDQDHDGSHIKGLIMNYFHHFFPSLLRLPGFLLEFITPIVKATKGTKSEIFYTMPEYEAWKESLGHNLRGWSIKYYKGLGTSTAKEAKEYFANLDEHVKEFVCDTEADSDAIDMAFSKKRVDERKTWLEGFEQGTYLDHTSSSITVSDFIHRELVLFSRADVERSIPSVMDGLKPGQRKILFCCFKRNLRTDIKVAQLAGYVSEHSAYHHGEASLAGAIIGLAQDFVGSNNVNLLVPSGQFGTRLQGGKDAASPRYIFTRLSAAARALFPEADDRLLTYNTEEGQSIEPEWYLPVIPTVLVNGADGIGTGWSTSVPTYNPSDIIAGVRALLRGEEPAPMDPWFRGYTGEVIREEKKRKGKAGTGDTFTIQGKIRQIDDTTVEITELPVRKWTQDYKEFLEGLARPESKTEQPSIIDYKEYHTDTSVHFTVTMTPEQMVQAQAVGLMKRFKLTTSVSTTNMTLFDRKGRICRYETPVDILREFFPIRLQYYEKRRLSLLAGAEAELKRLDNKARFILAVVKGRLLINNRPKKDIEADLDAQGFDRMPKGLQSVVFDDEEEGTSSSASFDYLLSMPLWNLTLEKVRQIQEDTAAQEREVDCLRSTTAAQMWETDLTSLESALAELDATRDANEKALQQARRVAQGRGQNKRPPKPAAGKGGKGKKGKKAASDSEDEWDDDDSDFEEPVRKQKAAPKRGGAGPSRPASGAAGSKAAAGKASTSTAAGSKAGAGKWQPPVAAVTKTGAVTKAAPSKAPDAGEESVEGEGGSLMARLAGRVAALKVQSDSTKTGKTAKASQATTARAASQRASKKASKYDFSGSESDVSESELSDSEGSDTEFTSPLKPAKKPGKKALGPPPGRAQAPPKRKPAAKPTKPAAAPSRAAAKPNSIAVSSPDVSGSAAGPAYSPAPITPSVMPKGKRIRVDSPAVAAAAKPAAAQRKARAKRTVVSESESESDGDAVEVVEESPAPVRRQRAAAKKVAYVVESSAEESDEASFDEDDSDFSDDE